MAWHNVRDDVGNIRLMAVDKDGIPSSSFPTSLTSMTQSGAISVSGDFQLASLNSANRSLDNLTVVWSESVSNDETGLVDHTILKASAFCSDGTGGYCLSAPQELAELDSRIIADHFDAYVSGENQIKAVIQATRYDDDNPVEDEESGIEVPARRPCSTPPPPPSTPMPWKWRPSM